MANIVKIILVDGTINDLCEKHIGILGGNILGFLFRVIEFVAISLTPILIHWRFVAKLNELLKELERSLVFLMHQTTASFDQLIIVNWNCLSPFDVFMRRHG